jgi:hypothetical protein
VLNWIRPLFAFNLDSKWPRDLSHIGQRQLLLRGRRLVCDAFAIQKCSRYFGFESEVHILRNISSKSLDRCGI